MEKVLGLIECVKSGLWHLVLEITCWTVLHGQVEVDINQIKILIENNQHHTMWEIANILKISKSIKSLVNMKNVSFVLWKKPHRLLGQPSITWSCSCQVQCQRESHSFAGAPFFCDQLFFLRDTTMWVFFLPFSCTAVVSPFLPANPNFHHQLRKCFILLSLCFYLLSKVAIRQMLDSWFLDTCVILNFFQV